MNLIELSKEEFIEFSKNYPYSLSKPLLD